MLFRSGMVSIFLMIIILGSCNYKPESKQPKWVTIDYRDLIDGKQIVRTGQSLSEVLKDASTQRHIRGAVQQYIDCYSYLLQYSVELLNGPDLIPHRSVVEYFPIGSKQQAWVAIFRGGSIYINSDGMTNARIFMIGEDAEAAYKANYSVIRHCLSGLLPEQGMPLNVEVYAYKNDYSKSELNLNLLPYKFDATSFPKEANKIALDLLGLQSFFNEGGELDGAKLDPQGGLILFAKSGSKQTLVGQKISISDFAVAYRAVFHAGDNEAFISLDPHKDPTKVTVNFGGFLEDTRIGSVVLESDKRFKTITSGLDPNSFRDIRRYTRQFVPTFMPVSERDLFHDFSQTKSWIGTRFWFYPDSVEIESDFDYQYARVKNPQFQADAERSKDDYANSVEFERRKQVELSPSIRENIDHLNQNYLLYAKAYPEIKELMTVARLMGICAWLKKAKTNKIDLDALLSVELPAFTTDREKTQLVAVASIALPNNKNNDINYIKENTSIISLTPFLDRNFKDYFSNKTNLAKYLCYKNNIPIENYSIYLNEASKLIPIYTNKKVRNLIKSKKDLQGFAEYASRQVDIKSSDVAVYKLEINNKKDELNRIESQLHKIKAAMETDSSNYNSYVPLYNTLVGKYENIRKELNQDIDRYNQLNIQRRYIIEIGGGINLGPKNFNISSKADQSYIRNFMQITKSADVRWGPIHHSGTWIRSSAIAGGSSFKNIVPRTHWSLENEFNSNGYSLIRMTSIPDKKYWMIKGKGSWRDLLKADNLSYRERYLNPETKEIHIATYRYGSVVQYLVGRIGENNRIVFTKSSRKDLLKPQDPPTWWIQQK